MLLLSRSVQLSKSLHKLIIQSRCEKFPDLSVSFHPPGRERVSQGMDGLFPSKAKSPQSKQRIRATIQIIQATQIYDGLNYSSEKTTFFAGSCPSYNSGGLKSSSIFLLAKLASFSSSAKRGKSIHVTHLPLSSALFCLDT